MPNSKANSDLRCLQGAQIDNEVKGTIKASGITICLWKLYLFHSLH